MKWSFVGGTVTFKESNRFPIWKILLYSYLYFLYPKTSPKIYYTAASISYTLKIPQKRTILQLLLSIPKKFRINLLYCCFYFPYPKNSAKIYYAILLLLLSIQFFLQKFTILLHLHSIPKTFRKNLLYCYFYYLYLKNSAKVLYYNFYFLYPKNSAKIYYIATSIFYI